jgi:predicted MFS family arabinose efflux permease
VVASSPEQQRPSYGGHCRFPRPDRQSEQQVGVEARLGTSSSHAAMFAAGAAIIGLFYYLSLYLQRVLGCSAIKAGTSLLPLAVGTIVAAGVASPLIARAGIRKVLLAGLVLFAAGLVWFAQLPVRGTYPADLLGPSLLIALGLGIAFVAITILSVSGVKDREYGLASGLVNTSQQIGGALGLAVLSSIATTRADHLVATGHPINQALTLGFHTAFLGAAGFVLVAIIAIASIGTGLVNREKATPARATA